MARLDNGEYLNVLYWVCVYRESKCPGKHLMTATICSSNDTPTGTDYYRYYVSNSTIGYADGLKYVFNSNAYAAAIAAGVNPITASDVTIRALRVFVFAV